MSRFLSFPIRAAMAVATTAFGLFSAVAADSRPAITEPAQVIQFDRDQKSLCEGLPGCEFILLAGDPNKSATQWLFRLRAGQAFPKHWHSTPENMVSVRGALTFNSENGQRHTLRPGEYLHYQAGMIHWGQCEQAEDCLFYVFNDQSYDIHVIP